MKSLKIARLPRVRKFMKRIYIIIIPLILAASSEIAYAQKIYVMTDLEGVSGVYQFAQTRDKGSPLNIQACEYFMDDLAYLIWGLQDGGAEEIVILDGHGNGSLIPHLMVPGATYITGRPRPGVGLWGLDETFDGLIHFGLHAMMGTSDGVLHHTQSSMTENRYWYNGVESGELAQVAAIAGYFGVPTIMVTGDVAACREAIEFFGEEIVTVATKEGISREAAVLYPFEETRQAIYEGAIKAIEAIPRCKPYILETPINARMQYLDLDPSLPEPVVITREWVIPDALHLLVNPAVLDRMNN